MRKGMGKEESQGETRRNKKKREEKRGEERERREKGEGKGKGEGGGVGGCGGWELKQRKTREGRGMIWQPANRLRDLARTWTRDDR